MKIEIRKVVIESIEVSLPIYRTDGYHYYKIFSEENCIQVLNSEKTPCIGIHHTSLAFHGEGNKDCTKEIFEEKLEQAIERVNLKAKEVLIYNYNI